MKHPIEIRKTIGLVVVIGAALFGQQQLRAADCCKPSKAEHTERASDKIDRHAIDAERISIFKVSLQCAAAPEIGCGSRAKPLLGD